MAATEYKVRSVYSSFTGEDNELRYILLYWKIAFGAF